MKKKFLIAVIICLAVLPVLAGCGDSTPVETFVLSDQPLADQNSIENAAKSQQEELGAENDIYACVSFIESPKGIEYSARWIQDGQTVKTENKKTSTEPRAVIVYTLEKGTIHAGELTVQILYEDDILAETEITVK